MQAAEPFLGRGLVLKLFGVCAVVAVVAVVAATWVTVQSTVVAEHQERQQSLHADTVVYDQLVGYAAQHPGWGDARGLVDRLAAQFGHRITVTDPTGHVLVSSGSAPARQPLSQARAVIDPTQVDSVIATTKGIGSGAGSTLGSLPAELIPSTKATRVLVADGQPAVDPRITATWSAARVRLTLTAVRTAANRCLNSSSVQRVTAITPRVTALVDGATPVSQAQNCLQSGLRSVLTGTVAPRALLFEGGGTATAAVFWDFSGANRVRIAGAAGLVLLVLVLVCGVLASQIVRPLRRMVAAAVRAGEGDLSARVPVRGRDELGAVAQAFNRMADRRQQLEETRQQMMTDISHELRAPLSNIRGWLEAAQDGLARPDRMLLSSLLEETMQLQRLVADVHQLATGDAGAVRLQPEPVEVRVVLEQVAAAFHGSARRAGIVIQIDAATQPVLQADPVRLRQAVTNLVANSLRHTSPGGRIRLSVEHGSITVVDDGEGIPPHAVQSVFDRFSRVDPSRTRATGGTGLGLSIVQQYMQLEGGSVELHSTVGIGTVVTLRFPARSIIREAVQPGCQEITHDRNRQPREPRGTEPRATATLDPDFGSR